MRFVNERINRDSYILGGSLLLLRWLAGIPKLVGWQDRRHGRRLGSEKEKKNVTSINFVYAY
jgi:hypothetical protein